MYAPAMTTPLLASEVVRFVGDPVALVLTEQSYQGQDAADLVEVGYDALPAVVDVRDAVRDEVLLFPDAGSNTVCAFGGPELDADLFDGCEVVVTRSCTTSGSRRRRWRAGRSRSPSTTPGG